MPRQTNIEVVTQLMDFSRSGLLMQAFVLHAIAEYARQVEASPDDTDFSNFPFPFAEWKRCATEARETIEQHAGK